MTENLLLGCDVLSIKDLAIPQIQQILNVAALLKKENSSSLLKDKLIAHCFFEASTRTRLSFESATLRLGGKSLGFASDEALSIQKGETLHDTIRMIENYADLIIIRHPKEGAARYAAEISDKPVINAGDGSNQHPTQTLVDLFSIYECQKRLEGLSIALVGDLKYGRTIHSFVQCCKLFDMRLFLVAPEGFSLPASTCDTLKKEGIRFSHHHSLAEVMPKIDILYMTRMQQERFSQALYQSIKNHFILTKDLLALSKPNLKILHPLPRVNEIEVEVDSTPNAYYFEQAANGLYVRQALLTLILRAKLP
jgi:aspartate carbamoyltransferase catalytic subunit